MCHVPWPVGVQDGLLIVVHKVLHTVLAKMHVNSMWSKVSTCWSQNEHASGCGRPRGARRSAVQHLFFMASHRKKRQRTGALDFHVNCAVADTSLPANFAA